MTLSSFPHLLLQTVAEEPQAVAGFLDQLSSVEKTVAGAAVVVFLLGCGAILDLSFKLLELQKLRLLAKIEPDALAEAGMAQTATPTSWWKTMYARLTDYVPVSKEDDIMLDHNYDGVRELDNNLPPWWKGVFYITIAFAPVYIYFAHFSDYGLSSSEAYVVEMEEAEADIKAFLATQENAVDESNVTLLAEADALAKGQLVYDTKCSVCHGKLGEGGIGPNLTDEYWLHGGDIKDIFRTIKYGVPEKGMIPWKSELRPRDMQEVASFIKTLVGTNPPGGKAPQGEIYREEAGMSK